MPIIVRDELFQSRRIRSYPLLLFVLVVVVVVLLLLMLAHERVCWKQLRLEWNGMEWNGILLEQC